MYFVLLLHFSNLNTKFAAERRRGQVQTFYSIQSEANSSLGNLSQLKKNFVAEKNLKHAVEWNMAVIGIGRTGFSLRMI